MWESLHNCAHSPFPQSLSACFLFSETLALNISRGWSKAGPSGKQSLLCNSQGQYREAPLGSWPGIWLPGVKSEPQKIFRTYSLDVKRVYLVKWFPYFLLLLIPKSVSNSSSKSKLITLRTSSASQICFLSFPSWSFSAWNVAYATYLTSVILGLSLQSVFPLLLDHSHCRLPGSSPVFFVVFCLLPNLLQMASLSPCVPHFSMSQVWQLRSIFKNPLCRNLEWLF